MNSKKNLLAATIGRALQRVPGQSVAFFPDHLGMGFLVEIARSVNDRDGASSASAVVLHYGGSNEDRVPVVNERELLSYRNGKRLVLASQPFVFDSSVDVFKTAIFEGFPSGEDGLITARDIASAALEELSVGSFSQVLIEPMTETLTILAKLYASSSDSFSESWNVYWYKHVAEGLQNVSCWLESSDAEDLSPAEVQRLFGLPSRSGSPLDQDLVDVANSYNKAVTNWWSSTESAHQSSNSLDVRRANGNSDSDLSESSLETITEYASKNSRAPIFFFKWLLFNAAEQMSFRISERDFLNPRYLGKKAVLRLYKDDHSLSIRRKGSVDRGPYFVPLSESETGSLECAVVARIKLNQEVQNSEIDELEVTITPRDSSLIWQSKSMTILQQELHISGSLIASHGSNLKDMREFSLVSDLDMTVTPTSALIDAVPANLSCQIVVLLDEPGQVLYFDGKKPKPIDYGLESTHDQMTVANDHDTLTILTSARNAQLDSKDMHPTGLGNWSTYTVSSAQHLELTSEDGAITFIRDSSGSNHKSPLIAAAYGEELGVAEPTAKNKRSARGMFEQYLSENAGDDSLLGANFHFLVGETSIFPQGISADYLSGFVTDHATYQLFQSQDDMEVDAEFLQSPEVNSFRQSYRDMNIPAKLSVRSGYESEWPSRSSWKSLFIDEKNSLDAYLSNYKLMVDLARRSYTQKEVFWATYPFSFSVWDLEAERAECKAVMLSPLHPLRLSWLASVEATLWNASEASQFLGTVEGWNLPYFGPSPVEDAAPMIAVPTDNGEGQLFLGWSMLVSLPNASWSTARSPRKIANKAGLGSSSTGFNASTAASALTAFQKLFPQLPSIVIDLSAQFDSPRLEEVDAAVLKTMKSWSSEREFYPGGVHVLDASSRLEPPPFDALSKVISERPTSKVSWTRYTNDRKTKVRSNLRLLQDPGIQMRVLPDGEEDGALDAIPVKRFITQHGIEAKGTTSSISPTIEEGFGWIEYCSALRACENSQSLPRLLAQLNRQQIADGAADWSITGDGMVSPSVMSKLLSEGSKTSGKQMLWEWRPPLSTSSEGIVNQKPFMTVARVPGSLPAQIIKMLERAQIDSAEDRANDVLKVLGSQGVGLASLLSSGGTHAYGAIGFYVAFKLISALDINEQEVFALPIDALNVYLERLGETGFRGDNKNRADILLLRLSKDFVTLSPIEIKLYGLKDADAQTTRLPQYEDSRLAKAKTQCAATTKLLNSIMAKATDCAANPDSADSVLWRNAFANLVEAAGKLSGTSSKTSQIKDSIFSILAGQARVTSEPGLVLFLHSKAETRTGKTFEFFDSRKQTGSGDSISVLTSDLKAIFEEMVDHSSPLIEKLNQHFSHSAKLDAEREALPTIDSPGLPVESVDSIEHAVTSEITPELDDALPSVEVSQVDPSKPKNIDGVRFTVGQTTHSDEEVYFWPSNTELTQLNIGILGNLGTGKTQFVMNLVANIRSQSEDRQSEPASFLILDYKKDYSDERFLKQVGGRSVAPERIPINVFELSEDYSSIAAYKKASQFVSTLSKVYSGIGHKQSINLINAIKDSFLAKNGKPPSLAEVHQRYISEIKEYDSVASILDGFVQLQIFDDDSENTLKFHEFLGNGVVSLSMFALGVDTKMKNAIVTVMLDLYLQHMMNAAKPPFTGSSPQLRTVQSYLLIDEASNIMQYDFGSLQHLLTEGREFGYGVILSSQYLSHFKTSSFDYAETLKTWMIHQVPGIKPANIVSLGISTNLSAQASEMSTLPMHHGLWSSYGFSGFIVGTPFYKSFGK
jgi:DNA phosphorothioation-dependent restriction protein DptH